MSSQHSDQEYKDFLEAHTPQLTAKNVPQSLWPAVFAKMKNQTLDAGASFQLQFEEGVGYSLICSVAGGLKKEKDVWIIDHAYTFKKEAVKDQLKQSPPLVERLAAMVGIVDDQQEEEDPDHEHRYDDHGFASPRPIVPHAHAHGHGHAAHASPTASSAAAAAASGVDQTTIDTLVKETGVDAATAAKIYQEKHGDLVEAMTQCKIAAGDEKQATNDNNSNNNSNALTIEQKIEKIYERLFSPAGASLAQFYSVIRPTGEGGVQTLYFVMDEVGSAIGYSDQPNAVLVPFLNMHMNGMAFSLLYLTKDVQQNDVITQAKQAH